VQQPSSWAAWVLCCVAGAAALISGCVCVVFSCRCSSPHLGLRVCCVVWQVQQPWSRAACCVVLCCVVLWCVVSQVQQPSSQAACFLFCCRCSSLHFGLHVCCIFLQVQQPSSQAACVLCCLAGAAALVASCVCVGLQVQQPSSQAACFLFCFQVQQPSFRAACVLYFLAGAAALVSGSVLWVCSRWCSLQLGGSVVALFRSACWCSWFVAACAACHLEGCSVEAGEQERLAEHGAAEAEWQRAGRWRSNATSRGFRFKVWGCDVSRIGGC